MSTEVLSKQYQPAQVESFWAEEWIKRGCFEVKEGDKRPPFCIVIPPPNITGTLHMGHALTLTIQDALVRYHRMRGFNTLWLPGTDHAGIATQMVVERSLQKEGLTRHQLGREEFLRRVWQWKEKHGKRINEQTKALGASVDWRLERFTMDEGLSRAVREVFVRLYEEGLIYRDLRLINWCPRCQTALSDLEVVLEPTAGKLWTIAYPLEDGSGKLAVATTRPETMLGDTAVAVNSRDERYRSFIGKRVRLPLTGRTIPVIVDDQLVDPEFGTGCVKVTPAHDFNDFEVGRRHNLPSVSVIGQDGRMTAEVGELFRGLDRFEAREKIVELLAQQGLLLKVEDYQTELSRCQRCQEIVEPLLSKQWFVKTKPLAEPAIQAVKEGRTVFIPNHWEKVYFEWMYNIRDWCISRQLWWGHRIPAWYCSCGEVIVARKEPEKCPRCGGKDLQQDPDVLDTWFSSALWPFSTLGWPDDTWLLRTFYPTSVMETGFDIIFFWVARMMMMGLHFMKEVPFRVVYLHAMVRDARGQKMSKTRGNVIDPLEVSGQYGADALRFTLASMTAQGRDIKLSLDRVEGYRNFINKIWNAARFALMNLKDYQPARPRPEARSDYDHWILARLQQTAKAVDEAFQNYKLNEACSTLYNFVWHELCDWYLELAKPILAGEFGLQTKGECQRVLLSVLDTTLRLLHPFTPFVTEEIWQRLPLEKPASYLAVAPWPSQFEDFDPKRVQSVQWLIEAISGIRTIRGENNLSPSQLLSACLLSVQPEVRKDLESHRPVIMRLAKLSELEIGDFSRRPRKAAVHAAGPMEVWVKLEGLVDFEAERQRVAKEMGKLRPELERIRNKLNNQDFLSRAPEEVVEKEKEKLAELEQRLYKLEKAAEQLERWRKED